MRLFERRLARIHTGSEEWHQLQQKISLEPSVGIGMERRLAFYSRTLPDCGNKLYVLPGVIFNYPLNIKIGYNVFINRGAYITARAPITIGDNALIGPYVVINSGSHHYADPNKLIRNQGHSMAPVIIEADVWIGAHATLLPGVTIKKGAVVAAGAVVTRSVESYTVVAGVPARLLKKRNNSVVQTSSTPTEHNVSEI